MSITYSLTMLIDWNNDGDFGDANEDVSSSLYSASIRHGRSGVNDVYAPGELSFTLRNGSGLYSAYNTGGALYGSILPERLVKLKITVNGSTIDLFTGYLEDIGQPTKVGDIPVVSFTAMDGLELMRERKVRIALQEDKRVDQLITTILDDYGWSASLRNLDTATYTLGQFWVHNAEYLAALRTAVAQELGGALYVCKSGVIHFRNKEWRSGKSSSFTTTGGRFLDVGVRRSDFVKDVRYKRAGLDVDDSVVTLFQLLPVGQQMFPGAAHPNNTLHGEYELAGRNVVTPVATTDYTFNSEADGSGSDKTGQVSVDSFTSYGGGFSITFNNADSSPVYLRTLQVRGEQVRRSNDERLIVVDVDSPIVTSKSISEEFEFNDDAASIEAYAQYTAEVSNQLQPRPILEIVPDTDAQLEQFVSLELGDILTIQNTDAEYGLYIDDQFSVESWDWTFAYDALPRVKMNLFHRDFVRGKMFRISDGSNNYSQLASPGDAGRDRIGW